MSTGWSGARLTSQISPCPWGTRLTSEGSATSSHISALVLLHALRKCLSMDAAPYLNQARATYLAPRLLWQVFFPKWFLKFLKWAIMPPLGISLLLVPQFWEEHTTTFLCHMH